LDTGKKESVRVDISGGIQASLAGRYAYALYELGRETKSLPAIETSLDTIRQALQDSPEFAALVRSQTVDRDSAAKAVAAIARTLKLDPTTANFLGVLAQNRRLGQLRAMLDAFAALAAAHRGEISATVTSAFPLSDAQVDAIRKQLKDRAGHSIKITTHVDPSILGGLIVRMGSQMIDSSIKTRLNTLSQAMKG